MCVLHLSRCPFRWFLGGDSWPLWLTRVVFWTPQNLELATFSLLVVFFAQVVYMQTWAQGGYFWFRVCVRIWQIFNFILLVLSFVWIACVGEAPITSRRFITTRTIMSGSLFASLTVVTAVYGYRLLRVLQSPKIKVELPKGVTLLQLRLFICFLLLMFISRFLYDFVGDLVYDLDSESLPLNTTWPPGHVPPTCHAQSQRPVTQSAALPVNCHAVFVRCSQLWNQQRPADMAEPH